MRPCVGPVDEPGITESVGLTATLQSEDIGGEDIADPISFGTVGGGEQDSVGDHEPRQRDCVVFAGAAADVVQQHERGDATWDTAERTVGDSAIGSGQPAGKDHAVNLAVPRRLQDLRNVLPPVGEEPGRFSDWFKWDRVNQVPTVILDQGDSAVVGELVNSLHCLTHPVFIDQCGVSVGDTGEHIDQVVALVAYEEELGHVPEQRGVVSTSFVETPSSQVCDCLVETVGNGVASMRNGESGEGTECPCDTVVARHAVPTSKVLRCA